MENTGLRNFVKEWRKERGLTQDQLAAMTDGTKSQISKIEKGSQKLNTDWMVKLSKALRIDPAQLLVSPVGEKAPSTSANNQGAPGELLIMGDVAAGMWLEGDLFGEDAAEKSFITPSRRYPAKSQYLLRVRGESLNKLAKTGDLLWCVDYLESGIEYMLGDLAIVERSLDEGHTIERTAKRIIGSQTSLTLMPESDDPRFQDPVHFEEGDEAFSEVRIKAKVLCIIKST